jgi:hypothetical protein
MKIENGKILDDGIERPRGKQRLKAQQQAYDDGRAEKRPRFR